MDKDSKNKKQDASGMVMSHQCQSREKHDPSRLKTTSYSTLEPIDGTSNPKQLVLEMESHICL